jgi:hypothetical protein
VRSLIGCFVLVAVFVSGSVGIANGANTYYVAPSGGQDSNSGAVGAPFATISHAISTAAPGDTIYLRGGSYMLSSLGQTGARLAADADHNGVINQVDYLVWQTRFAEAYGSAAGVGNGAGAIAAGVAPEPNSLFLATVAALAILLRRR